MATLLTTNMFNPLTVREHVNRPCVRVVPGQQLSAQLCCEWRSLQRSNPALSSPYFSPEFTQLVASIRNDVEVAVVEQADRVVAVLPFQRGTLGAAKPVAGRLNDFQAVISAPEFQLDPKQLLHESGLRSWKFDHLLTSQVAFEPYMWTRGNSPYVDLSRGFAAYEAERRAENSEFSTIKRKLKKMEREIGPARLEWKSTSREYLETLLRWKSEQYTRTGIRDLFSIDWILKLVEELLKKDDPNLTGMLTCLYAGDRLVAAHLGMNCRHVLHWWFPSYDRDLGRYSPGMSLIYLIAQHAHEHGITRIDLGKGDEDYKFRIASGIDQVAEGSVDLNPGSRLFRRTWQATRDWLKTTPLAGPVSVPLKAIRRVRDWFSFQ
ncbi:GNAT family N-acetyltransferase [Anatilimnocola sp. NA78]|uniref:GNAT family N-acetyltransferase n=1 Tax=Anatilimnocola sp. NA78 TaxID=3415683 RepID=UPI003CE4C2FA